MYNIIHQDLSLKAYFHERHYDIDEVAELADLDAQVLEQALTHAVIPEEILEK